MSRLLNKTETWKKLVSRTWLSKLPNNSCTEHGSKDSTHQWLPPAGQFGLCDPMCSCDTVPADCTSSQSCIPYALNFGQWKHCSRVLKHIPVITLTTLNLRNITKLIQACLAIHWGCISSLNIYSATWAEWWAQDKSPTIHLHLWGLERIPIPCEEGSC